MSEKVLHEVQIIETDDGFRIELKGDKEMLRPLIARMSSGGFGRFAWHGRAPEGHEHPLHTLFAHRLREARRGHQRHFGGRWEARWGYDMGPWWDETASPDEESPDNL